MKKDEKNLLKLTLDILVNENKKIKNEYDELKKNVKEFKIQLQEKLNTIYDKNSAMENLNIQIEKLHLKLNELLNKKNNFQEIENNNKINNNLNKSNINIFNEKNLFNINNNNKIKEIDYESYKKYIFLQNKLINSINDLKRETKFIIDKYLNKDNIIIFNKNKINLKNYFDNDFNEIFNKKLNKNNMIYLIDKNKKIWKLKKREDLNYDFIEKNIDFYSNLKIKKIQEEMKMTENNIRNLIKKLEENKIKENDILKEIINENNIKIEKEINENKKAITHMMQSSFIL